MACGPARFPQSTKTSSHSTSPPLLRPANRKHSGLFKGDDGSGDRELPGKMNPPDVCRWRERPVPPLWLLAGVPGSWARLGLFVHPSFELNCSSSRVVFGREARHGWRVGRPRSAARACGSFVILRAIKSPPSLLRGETALLEFIHHTLESGISQRARSPSTARIVPRSTRTGDSTSGGHGRLANPHRGRPTKLSLSRIVPRHGHPTQTTQCTSPPRPSVRQTPNLARRSGD